MFEAQAVIDRTTEYSVMADLLIEKKLVTLYKPNVQIKVPGRSPVTLTGTVQYKPAERLDLNLSLQKLFQTPVELTGNYLINSKLARSYGSLEVSSGLLDAKVEGRLDDTDVGVDIIMTVEYAYNHGPQRKVSFNTKLWDQSTENSFMYGIDG